MSAQAAPDGWSKGLTEAGHTTTRRPTLSPHSALYLHCTTSHLLLSCFVSMPALPLTRSPYAHACTPHQPSHCLQPLAQFAPPPLASLCQALSPTLLWRLRVRVTQHNWLTISKMGYGFISSNKEFSGSTCASTPSGNGSPSPALSVRMTTATIAMMPFYSLNKGTSWQLQETWRTPEKYGTTQLSATSSV
jgi:hypothetical protein